ncbi:MAG: hypothetical protein AABZ34_00795 [Nitrospirota bacterium]
MIGALQIGTVPWTNEDMRKSLREFVEVYERRPIRDNSGGMQAPHMFLAWFVLKTLSPKAIIESGLWLGQGTWLFEQACPAADLHCIDIDLSRLQYRSNRATYYNRDFSTIDWSNVSKNETALFFDDHQNAYQRVMTAKWFGFSHLLFEDNYPPSRGDCYSLKKVFAQSGFAPTSSGQTSLTSAIKNQLASLFKPTLPAGAHIPPNSVDAQYLRRNIITYHELPPVFKVDKTRWGDPWDNQNYPTPTPVLSSVEEPYQQVFVDEAMSYTWMSYVKMKHG